MSKHQEDSKTERLREVSKAQRKSLALDLSVYRKHYSDRTEAMARAYLSGAYSMSEIGEHFGIHYMTVSLAVKCFEQKNDNRPD